MTKHSHCVNTFDVIAGKFGTIRKPSPLQGRPLPSWLSWVPGQPTISTTMNTNEETAESDAAKTILASRRSWLFARRRKSVRFSVDDTGTSSVKNTNIQEKWRKYVEQQFKTLKKHKRNRWLGRGQKRRRKLESDFVARNNSDEKGAGPSFANGLDDSSIDVLPSFEYHPPDHKKRKKSLSKQSKNGRSQTITITTTNTTNKSANRNKKSTTQNQGLPSPDGEPPMLEKGVGQNDMTLTSLKEGEEEDLPYLKRPLNAFILFSKACRQEFRNLLVPTFESKVVSMVLGHIWRYLSKEERTTFYHQAEQSRQHFHEEKNKRQHLAIDGQQGTNKEEEVLKRPMNGFMLFCQEQRAHLDSKVTGFGAGRRLVRQMARKWHRMKPRVKQVYISRAEEDRKIFCQKKNQSADQENVTSRDKEGEGDGTEDKPDPDLFQKISKNNNMLGPDPSDTDGSHPQVSMSTVRTSLQCPTVVTSGQQTPDTQAFCISMDADNNDTSGSGDETNGPENMQQPSQKTANLTTISRTASYETSDPCVAQEGKDKPGRSRRRKKKKPRVRRLKRHVYWKDEIQPWDVFNPVSSALCDEDICTRLYTTPESRDDSWLHTDPVSCHADANSMCQHHPPSFSPRPCSSCLSLGSLKKKVKIAFQKPEIELANWSSSLSSLCDLCSQAIVSDSVSLSSEDSCLYHLLNQCHLSDQNFTNSSFFKSDISNSSSCPHNLNQYYMSTPCDDQTKLGSCMTRSEELCTCNNIQWNKPVRGSNIQITISHLKKKPNHSSAGRKPCCSSFMQPDESKQEDECCYSRTGKGLRGKGKSCKLFREKSCPTCREYLGKTYLLQNTQTHQPEPDASLSSNCSHCNGIVYSTVICDDVNKNSLTHKASPSMDVMEVNRPTLIELSHETAACKSLEEQIQHSKTLDELSSETTNQPNAISVKDSIEMPIDLQNSTSVMPGSKSNLHNPSLGPSVDVSLPAETPKYGGQKQVSSSPSVVPHLSEDEVHNKHGERRITNDQTSVLKLNKLALSSKLHERMKKSDSVIWLRSKYLKRKLSFDSLEAMHSSKKFPVSEQSLRNLSKYPFALHEDKRTKASEPVQNVTAPTRNAAQVRKRPLCSPTMVHSLLPEDLELEYCQKKSWI